MGPSRVLRESRVASVASRLRAGRQFSAMVPLLLVEQAETLATHSLKMAKSPALDHPIGGFCNKIGPTLPERPLFDSGRSWGYC